MSDEQFHFEGFGEPFFTQTPDSLFDDLMPQLTEAELKVLLYIVRRTFGFKKSADDISLKQLTDGIVTRDGKVLDHGTGLSKPSVTKGVKGLEEKGIIVTVRNSSPERGDLPTTYRLRFKGDAPGVKNVYTGGVNNLNTGGKDSQHGRVTNLYPQDRVEQDTDLQATGDLSNHLPTVDKFIREISGEFHDPSHIPSNIQHTRRLFADSGLDEQAFMQAIYEARAKTKTRGNIRKTAEGGLQGTRNRMPYFFSVLRDLLDV